MIVNICSKCHEEKELEFFGNNGNRCKACVSAYNAEYHKKRYPINRSKKLRQVAEYRKANPEKTRSAVARWHKANPEKVSANIRKFQKSNPEKLAYWGKRYRESNPDKVASNAARWAKNNPGKRARTQSLRQSKKLNATPLWADQSFIDEIYDLAQQRAKSTGVKWHVDHIVPLRSKLVCGLHVEYNLRVIPAVENLRKGNKLIRNLVDINSI